MPKEIDNLLLVQRAHDEYTEALAEALKVSKQLVENQQKIVEAFYKFFKIKYN